MSDGWDGWDGMDGMGLSYTAVTPRASLMSDANNSFKGLHSALLSQKSMLIAHTRRANPGVNSITASVRSTYGDAHQVVFPSMCCTDTSAQVGMNSNLPQFQERRKFLVREVSKVFCFIYSLHLATTP